jgi:hypothetical protein
VSELLEIAVVIGVCLGISGAVTLWIWRNRVRFLHPNECACRLCGRVVPKRQAMLVEVLGVFRPVCARCRPVAVATLFRKRATKRG